MDLNQLKKLQAKLKQINQVKIEQDLKTEILDNADEIVKLVRERWKQGKRPDGSIIGEYKSFAYQQEKLLRNPLANGNVDLIDTGDLNRQLVVNHLSGSLFNIFSTDEKAVNIAEKYGLDVYGVTKEEEFDIMQEAGNRVMKKNLALIGL